jgi:hypothetical protein
MRLEKRMRWTENVALTGNRKYSHMLQFMSCTSTAPFSILNVMVRGGKD